MGFFERTSRRLGRLRGLTPVERRLLVRAWGLLAGVEVMLRLGGFRRLETWSTRGGPNRPSPLPAAEEGETVARLQWLTAAAARLQPLPTRCLGRSLVLRRLLAEGGRPTELKIGVRREGAELEAHAWLELDGRPLDAEQAARGRFAPLRPIGSAAEAARTSQEPAGPPGSAAPR